MEELDRLDAAIFSGDFLEFPENCAALREALDRWSQALDERTPS